MENTVTRTDLFRLGKCLVDVFISSYAEAPSVVILDCDDTNNDAYGQQELALFNDYYNERCYMPVRIYEGLSGNAKLHELSRVTVESAKNEFDRRKNPVKRYHSFMYKAAGWENYQRVIAKVEATSMGTNIRYIVTDMKGFRARDLYEKGYCARGSMELRIKDHKLYLKSVRSSCSKFTANQFRLFMHSMAYVLIHTLRKEVLKGTEYANATMKTVQIRIIKTAAWVKEMKTRIKIELPRFCPTKNEQLNGFEMLLMLRT